MTDERRFADGYGQTRTLQVIADDLACTRERVRQIEARALESLLLYSRWRLGRDPVDFHEVAGLFSQGPDRPGVVRARVLARQGRR